MADVIIVGAGAAGIGAALELRARGIDYVILEAADRVGGRAFTDTTSLATAWDQGCHWLHCADENPLVPWADKTGARYLKTPSATSEEFLWTAGTTCSETDVLQYYKTITAAYDQIDRAGRDGQDVPLTEVLPDTGPWTPNALCMLGLLAGDDAQYISTQGYADYRDIGQDWPVRSGYGQVLASMAEGLSIELATPVTAITQTDTKAQVETQTGTRDAKAVIVTASTNVLSAGTIRFGPGPAADLLPLIADVPCGAYEKVAMTFTQMPESLRGKRHGMITPKNGPSMNFQITEEGVPMVIVHMAGDLVRDLRFKGEAAMTAHVWDHFALALGPDVLASVDQVAVTDWLHNPWVRGSYSASRPGTAPGRYKMMNADTGRVAFAGEAFSLGWQATAHGAYQSGRDVAARLAPYAE